MTSLWLSGSVSAAETLPIVQVGHHAQAPAGKGQDAAKGGDSKGKGQDPGKGAKGQAPQAPCHDCKINFLDKLKARLGDLNLGRKCHACDAGKGQAPCGKGQDGGKGQDAAKGGHGKGQDAAKGGKGQDAAKGGDSKGKGQDAAKGGDGKGKGQAPQAPCHECKLNLLDKLKARLGNLNLGHKCNTCEVSHKGQAPAGKGQDGKGQDGKGGKGDSKGAAPMPAKAAPAKQVSTPVPAIPDLKNPF